MTNLKCKRCGKREGMKEDGLCVRCWLGLHSTENGFIPVHNRGSLPYTMSNNRYRTRNVYLAGCTEEEWFDLETMMFTFKQTSFPPFFACDCGHLMTDNFTHCTDASIDEFLYYTYRGDHFQKRVVYFWQCLRCEDYGEYAFTGRHLLDGLPF